MPNRNEKTGKKRLVSSIEDIPSPFSNREEEAQFWENHDFSEDIFESGPEVDREIYAALEIPIPNPFYESLVKLGLELQKQSSPEATPDEFTLQFRQFSQVFTRVSLQSSH